MAIVQRIAGDKKTLAEMASAVITIGMAEAGTNRWVDFARDVYQENSIMDYEREIKL